MHPIRFGGLGSASGSGRVDSFECRERSAGQNRSPVCNMAGPQASVPIPPPRCRILAGARCSDRLTSLREGGGGLVEWSRRSRTLTWVQSISAVRRIYWRSSGHRE